jgi:hypothetical protein
VQLCQAQPCIPEGASGFFPLGLGLTVLVDEPAFFGVMLIALRFVLVALVGVGPCRSAISVVVGIRRPLERIEHVLVGGVTRVTQVVDA